MGKGKFIFLLPAVLCMLLTGCRTGEAGADAAAKTEEAAFTPKLDTEAEASISIIGYMENFESLEAVISDFAAYYPNCKVQYDCMHNYDAMIENRLAGDDSVGIFMISNKRYKNAVRDKCADLSQEDIDTSCIQPEALISCMADDGKLYEIPLAYNTSGLIVNTTLLENEGLSVPVNYEEFLSVCESLKKKGYTPIQGYHEYTDVNAIRNMAFVMLSQACDTQEKMETLTSGGEGCEALLPAFEVLCGLHEKGYIDSVVNAEYEDNYDKSILRFFEGNVPFLAGTAETFSGTKKRETKSEHFSAEPFEYEFICVPLSENGAYSYIENWQGFAVNTDCTNREWAVEFMRFLATKEEINKLAYIKGLPSVAVESDDARFAKIYSTNENMIYTNDSYFTPEINDALYEAVKGISEGEFGAEGAVEEMETQIRAGDS